jgi:hypothetical protein
VLIIEDEHEDEEENDPTRNQNTAKSIMNETITNRPAAAHAAREPRETNGPETSSTTLLAALSRGAATTRESSLLETRPTGSGAINPGPLPGSLQACVQPSGYLGPATVLEVNEREPLVLVQWERTGQSCLSWARPALLGSPALKPGDVALVLSQNLEDFYVIGLLTDNAQTPRPVPGLDGRGLRSTAPLTKSAALQTRDGASVVVAQAAGEEVIQVRSKQGTLVVEYHPESAKTLVNVENGDLEFVTHHGNISFKSAQAISLSAPRLETEAETVVAKAGNVYQTVTELTQLQTGRMRTLVEGSCLLKARNAFLKADQDFKVDGQQIHLG